MSSSEQQHKRNNSNTIQSSTSTTLDNCPLLNYAIWVSNISNNVNVEDLLRLFTYCGAIKQIIFKKLKNESKDAIIIFDNQLSFDTAMLLNNVLLLNNPIQISNSIPSQMLDSTLINRLQQQYHHQQQQQQQQQSSSPNSSPSKSSPIRNSPPSTPNHRSDEQEIPSFIDHEALIEDPSSIYKDDNTISPLASPTPTTTLQQAPTKSKGERFKHFIKHSFSNSKHNQPI